MRITILLALLLCGVSLFAQETVLYIVRHAQTDWNAKDVKQGHTDIPLNEVGKLEAANLGALLESIAFRACYSSDLQRAIETAHFICGAHFLSVKGDARLRGCNFGSWEGRICSEIPEFSSQSLGIESEEEMKERVFPFLQQIVKEHTGSNVLIVTHRGVIRAILRHLLNNAEGILQVDNTGILELKIFDDKWEIQKLRGIQIT